MEKASAAARVLTAAAAASTAESAVASRRAMLVIDPQRAFVDGAWARHFGDVEPIIAAFDALAVHLASDELAGVALMTTRVPYAPPDDELYASLSPHLREAPQLLKPTTDVTANPRFNEWLCGQINDGVGALLVCGCTTTSCVRVSSQRIKHAFPSLRVVVDLALCGARSANHAKCASEDAELVNIYGPELCRGRSAVDLAAWQMEKAGVVVVDSAGSGGIPW